jgi:hypothetical protein
VRQQDLVLATFAEQNEIIRLLSCACDCKSIQQLPEPIREPIKNLFGYSFDLLASMGIRDECYRLIFDGMPYRVCAFCGVEYFDAPGAPREPLDHYLAQSRYPFAAANLQNLVPMGHKCNSKYKLSKDILRNKRGVRRRAFNPYGSGKGLKISLSKSIPFAGARREAPAWHISFGRSRQEVDTWDDVFRVRERYMRDILDQEFNPWLSEFAAWCWSRDKRIRTRVLLMAQLQAFVLYHERLGLNERSFLKSAVFRMLLSRCKRGDARLIEFLLVLVGGAGAVT